MEWGRKKVKNFNKIFNAVIEITLWVFVFLSIICLIMTQLTLNNFVVNEDLNKYLQANFRGYGNLQWCLFYTMVLMAIKVYRDKTNSKNVLYAVICVLMAVCSLVFIYFKIFYNQV